MIIPLNLMKMGYICILSMSLSELWDRGIQSSLVLKPGNSNPIIKQSATGMRYKFYNSDHILTASFRKINFKL
jgi:hypothetical protein